jgi:hypothetical protein
MPLAFRQVSAKAQKRGSAVENPRSSENLRLGDRRLAPRIPSQHASGDRWGLLAQRSRTILCRSPLSLMSRAQIDTIQVQFYIVEKHAAATEQLLTPNDCPPAPEVEPPQKDNMGWSGWEKFDNLTTQ